MTRFLILVCLLSGCAQMGYTYRKPGSSEAEYRSTIYSCAKDSAPVQDVMLRRMMINQCMGVHGWTATFERM